MAIIIPDHNLTFIHIPKTGGSSITKWLQLHVSNITYYRKHCSVQTAQDRWTNLGKTFCVIRDPYDWLVSWYEYEKVFVNERIANIKSGNIKQFKINPEKDNLSVLYNKLDELNKGFEYFVKNNNKDNQTAWAKNVDIVLRFEHLDTDFQKIQKIIGCNIPLEKINTTVRSDIEQYYTRKLKKITYAKYREDFDFLANLNTAS